jgi:murein L,D-transpeptidase YcbB/YkuD
MSPRKTVVGLILLGSLCATPALAGRDDGPYQGPKPEVRRGTGASPFDFLFSRKKKRRIEVFEDRRRKKRKQTRIVLVDEPQAAPSRRLKTPLPDTGNLVYRPEELKPLFVSAFEEPEPFAAAALAIRAALLDKSNPTRVTAEERKAIAAFYAAHGFQPLWTTASGLSLRAKDLVQVFTAADAEGFDPGDFALPAASPGDASALAHLELAVSAKALAYARQASGGRLLPNRLTSYHDLVPERADPAKVLETIAWAPYPGDYLKGLQPRHPAYAALKAELAQVRARLEIDEAPIPEGRKVREGARDPRIPLVRQRLGLTAHLTAQAFGADGLAGHKAASKLLPDALDPALANALREYQRRHDLRITGVLDNQTVRALNGRTGKRDETRLILNMERLRWLPEDLGERHIFVNQAAFEMIVEDKGREIWRTNVIVGRPDTQTAVFHDEMETVVFNPAWGVPSSIIADEMLPILRRDPTYLDRLGFAVLNKRGRRVKSSSVRWASYGERVPFSVMQPPGGDNALGEIKFLFPNKHDIYMHDTPSRRLFSRPVRTFSHGCVRVENPRRLAEIVLGWSAEEISQAIDSRRSRAVGLKSKLPVYLGYFTAWPDSAGNVVYFNDVYGRDRTMEQALMSPRLALR